MMPAAGDLPYAFRRLRAMGIGRISCIGGRTLARQLIDARLVQDLYLTTGTKAGGEPNTPLYQAPLNGRRLSALFHQLDLEQLPPELSRHQQPIVRGVVRNAVQPV